MSTTKQWLVAHARAIGTAVVCLLGIGAFANATSEVYAIREWLAWPVLMLWAYTLLFSLACVSTGHTLLLRVFRVRVPVVETWAFAFPLGLAAFGIAMYLLGAVGGFRPLPMLLLPIVLVAAGARDLPWLWLRTARAARRGAPITLRSRLWALGLLAFGGVGCLLLYLISFSPLAIGFDASWYHFPVAHDYVRHGGFVAFPGDYVRTLPHLDSLAYTWAFAVPGTTMPFDWMLALHLEYAVVMWSAVGVSAATRWMVRDDRLRGSWVAMFLFPQIFAFGFSVQGGADHFVGLWAVPVFLATMRALPRLELRWCALVGVTAGGAVLSKYQAVYVITACSLMLVVRWCVLAIRLRKQRTEGVSIVTLGRAPFVVLGTALLVAGPHFLKNAIFYRNPLYPFAQSLFRGSSPTHDRAAELFENMLGETGNHPRGDGLERVWNTLELLWDFSFHPHYTVGYVADWPVFGSLFTLLLPCVLLLRRPGRIAAGALVCIVTLVIWSNTYLTDRYLVAVVPMFIATTAALIVSVHRLGTIARIGLVPLVAFQIVWGSDHWVWSGKKAIDGTMTLARSGWEEKLDEESRFPYWRTFRKVTRETPTDAKILIRGSRPTLGIDRDVVEDLQWNQALLWYETIHDPHELWQLYRDVGITHLLWLPEVHYSGTIQSSVLFALLVNGRDTAGVQQRIDGWRLMPLPDRPPAASAPIDVLVHDLRFYPNGLYLVQDLRIYGRMQGRDDAPKQRVQPRMALGKGDAVFEQVLADAEVVVLGAKPTISKAARKLLEDDFVLIEALERAKIYARRELVRLR
jgi:hypothetical protein